jgi:ribosomal protein L17
MPIYLCPTQDSQNAMLGGMTLDMDEIIATHRITSPQVKTYGIITPNSRIDSFLKKVVPSSLLFSTGSTYNELLRTALNLSSQNEMDKFHRLIYAGALNTLTEKPPTDDVLSKMPRIHLRTAVTADDIDMDEEEEDRIFAATVKHNVEVTHKSNDVRLATAVTACQAEIKALERKRFSATIVKQNFSDIAEKYLRRKGGVLNLATAKPKAEDYAKLHANELYLYIADDKLQYIVKNKVGKIQEGEMVEGEDKDQIKKTDIDFLKNLLAQKPLPTKFLCVNDACLNQDTQKVMQALFDITIKRGHTDVAKIPPAREAAIAFIRTADKKLQNSNEPVTNHSFNNTARHAVIVDLMEELEAEYSRHSDLYEILQEAINLKSTKRLSILEKYNYYSALHAFVPKINPHAEEPCNWLVAPIPNANQYLSDITGRLLRKMSAAYEALENGHINPTLDSIRCIINMAMGFVIGIAIGSFAGGLVTLAPEQKVFSRCIASFARSRYGYAAEIVAKQTAAVVEQAALTAVVSKSIKKATNYISDVPGTVVYYTLNIPANIYTMIEKMTVSLPERKFHESIEFINALISLPDKYISNAAKDKLRKIEIYMPDIVAEDLSLQTVPILRRSKSM